MLHKGVDNMGAEAKAPPDFLTNINCSYVTVMLYVRKEKFRWCELMVNSIILFCGK